MTDDTLIADLMRAGVDPELVGRVSNSLLNVRDMSGTNTTETVRAYERDRKRAQREAAAAQQHLASAKANDVVRAEASNVRDNVRDSTAERCDLSSLLSSESQKGLTEKGSSESKKARSENARGARIERDAVLSAVDRAAAIELGAEPDRVDGMWAEFLDYWIGIPGQRGRKSDWPATWRNRVRDVVSRGHKNGQRFGADRTNSATGQGQSGSHAVLAGVAAAFQRRRPRGDPGEARDDAASEGADATQGPDARLL